MRTATLPTPVRRIGLNIAKQGHAVPDRLVAAVRWDYEYGLLSVAQCIARYSTLLCAHTVRDICASRIYPDVKASRMKLLWR